MRHLTAAQKGDGEGWHYVSMSREGAHPIGACVEHEPHATEAEARECYAAHLRGRVVLDENSRWSWGSCGVTDCPNPSQRAARVEGDGFLMAFLCDDHWTVENAVEAMHFDRPAGDRWMP